MNPSLNSERANALEKKNMNQSVLPAALGE